MSEQIPWNGILAVIGVLIGFLLSQLTDLMKNRRRKTLIKKALTNELSIIRKTLSDSLQKDKDENRIPDERFPFITEAYDSVKMELASFLKPESLAVVQKTYEEIRKMKSRDIVIAGSYDHIYQFVDFKKLITLIDNAITRLK